MIHYLKDTLKNTISPPYKNNNIGYLKNMRCYICNFSETGINDPLIEEHLDIKNRVVYDEVTGEHICTSCLTEVYESLDVFEEENDDAEK